ncbi:MAG: aminotransferase class V-fold PLP-dependent enzyme [Elusimicrobia bacterium]|nr:aminotransferase class V-fold PLP-dependent enzyme [Elusimicrobiota bacterium]
MNIIFPHNGLNQDKHPAIITCGYGRSALEYGYRLLGLGAGDEILYPDFICDVVMVPAKKLGIAVRFYPTDDTLCPDLYAARRLLNQQTRAMLAVNYFGFPQPFAAIKNFCREHGLFFIEDNAQGFLSKQEDTPLGLFGDISIFSMRKTIPLINGAALLVNLDGYAAQCQNLSKLAVELPQERNFLKAIKTAVKRQGRRWNCSVDGLLAKPWEIPESGSTENEDLNYGFSPGALAALRKYDFTDECLRRRNAFQHWLDWSGRRNDVAAVFSLLPEGVVPYAFPAYVRDRRAWLEWGRKNHIRVSTWPTLPKWVAGHRPAVCQRTERLVIFPCLGKKYGRLAR